MKKMPFEKFESKREEKREAKMPPAVRARKEKAEAKACKGKKK